MSTTARIGKNARIIARARGMSLRAVAKAMDFNNEQVLFTRLSGKSKMSVEELEKLAGVLEVEVSVLLSDPDGLLFDGRTWIRELADQAA